MRAIVWIGFLCLVSACSCDPTTPVTECVSSSDCLAGMTCADGRCVTAMAGDTGTDDTSTPDTSVPPDTDDGLCSSDSECDGEEVCLTTSGACCAPESVCGGNDCCEGAETCFAGACVTPGADCRTTADCEDDQYCEPALGEGPSDPPMLDRVCLEGASNGVCLDLPTDLEECEFRPEVTTLSATEQWQWGPTAEEFPGFTDVWATPTVGRVYDTNCDGELDRQDPPNVVFVSGDARGTCCSCGGFTPSTCLTGVLRVLDGKTGQELWSLDRVSPTSIGFAGLSVALGDVTRDGRMEIVAMTGEGNVVIISGAGEVLMTSDTRVTYASTRAFGWGGGLAIADMDGDGAVEIAYGATVFSTAGGMLRERFTGSPGTAGGANRALSFFANVAGDEDLELIAGRTVYAADGSVVWSNTADLGATFPALGDFDADGAPDLVAVSRGMLSIHDAATGVVKYGPLAIPGTGTGGPPTVADFDGDGAPEIGVAMQNFYSMFQVADGALEVVWQTPNHDLSSSVTGSTVFDFEGDGIAEVIYMDECFLWVYDGPTGAVRFATPTLSFTATEASLVADVDDDGHAEMIMTSNGANPTSWRCNIEPWISPDPALGRPAWAPPEGETVYRGLTVFRDTANSWVGTRALWNQHAYHVTNICDDRDTACEEGATYGSIPARQRDNWSVPWLNNFRQNVGESGIFNAPDATVSLEVGCDPLELRASVRNLGSAILPPGVEVGFYARRDGEDILLGSGATSGPLFPGQVGSVTLTDVAGTRSDVYVAKILIDEDARTFRECREGNNESDEAMAMCLL